MCKKNPKELQLIRPSFLAGLRAGKSLQSKIAFGATMGRRQKTFLQYCTKQSGKVVIYLFTVHKLNGKPHYYGTRLIRQEFQLCLGDYELLNSYECRYSDGKPDSWDLEQQKQAQIVVKLVNNYQFFTTEMVTITDLKNLFPCQQYWKHE